MINVVCVKWGDKYCVDYVNNLYHAVNRHTTIDFKFHCLTENPTGINEDIKVHPLPGGLESWWNKVYLFSGDLNITGRMVFIDLDTLITSNIDDILLCDHEFVAFKLAKSQGNNLNKISSAFMAWDAGKHTYLWDEFIENKDEIIGKGYSNQYRTSIGDQGWVDYRQESRVYWQDLFPDRFSHFVFDCDDGLPDGTSVVVYEGMYKIVESFTEEFLDYKIQYKSHKHSRPVQAWVKEHWYGPEK